MAEGRNLPVVNLEESLGAKTQPIVIPTHSYILELRKYQQQAERRHFDASHALFQEAALLRREVIRLQHALESKTGQLASAARAAREHRTGTYDRAFYKARRDAKKARKAESKARRKAKQITSEGMNPAAKCLAVSPASTPAPGCAGNGMACNKGEY